MTSIATNWSSISLFALAALNLLCLAFSIWRGLRSIAAERQALQAAELLRHVCVQAYMAQHRPIWQIWANCMGSINVKVAFVRNELDDPNA